MSTETVYISQPKLEEPIALATFWRYFNPLQIRENLAILDAIDINQIHNLRLAKEFYQMRSEVHALYQAYAPILPDLLTAPITREALLTAFPEMQYVQAEDRTAIQHYVRDVQEPFVFISGSHATTLDVAETANELYPEGKICVIVLDSHIDVYGNPRDQRTMSSKASFIRHGIEEGVFTSVAVVGAPDEHIKDITASPLDPESYTIKPDRASYRRAADKLLLVSREDFADIVQHETIAREICSFMKSHGGTNLYFSIDIDLLALGFEHITVPEYNPLLALLSLSVQNFNLAQMRAFQEYGLANPVESVARYLCSCIRRPDYQLLFQDVKRDPQARKISNIMRSFIPLFNDISVQTVLHFIQVVKLLAPKYGIKIGIGNLRGDITEVYSETRDVNGKTAQAVKMLSDLLTD